jgi:hypothetical protein
VTDLFCRFRKRVGEYSLNKRLILSSLSSFPSGSQKLLSRSVKPPSFLYILWCCCPWASNLPHFCTYYDVVVSERQTSLISVHIMMLLSLSVKPPSLLYILWCCCPWASNLPHFCTYYDDVVPERQTSLIAVHIMMLLSRSVKPPSFLYLLSCCWTCSRPKYVWNICDETLNNILSSAFLRKTLIMAHTVIKKPCKISTGINVADNRKMNHNRQSKYTGSIAQDTMQKHT